MQQEDRFRFFQGKTGVYIYDYDRYTMVEKDGAIYHSEDPMEAEKFRSALNREDRKEKAEKAALEKLKNK